MTFKIVRPITIQDTGAAFSRSSIATYYDSTATILTVAANVRRVNFDVENLPFSQELLEASSTNVLTNNESFTTSWATVGATLSTSGISPTSGSCKLLTLSALNEQHYVYLTAGVIPSGSTLDSGYWTISVYLKPNGATQWVSIGDDVFFANFDLVNAVTGNVGRFTESSEQGVLSSIQRLGSSGWIRCSMSFDSTNSGAAYSGTVVKMANIDATTVNPVFLGNGLDGIFIFGAQAESGTLATSYISSNGASATTRAADVSNSMLASNVTENDNPLWVSTRVYTIGDAINIIAQNVHKTYESKTGISAPVTITVAVPGVVTWIAHGLVANTPVRFEITAGALPTGLIAGTAYYVLAPATDTFTVSATPGGAAITTTGSTTTGYFGYAGNNLNKNPATETEYWLDLGATNCWKMFDRAVQSQTTNEHGIRTTISTTGRNDSISILNLDANLLTITGVSLSSLNVDIPDYNVNHLRNKAVQGADLTTNKLPDFWETENRSGGIITTVVDYGQLEGINYVDIKISGTPITDFTSTRINFDGFPFSTPAVTGQDWCASLYRQLISGSNTGISVHVLSMQEYTDADVLVTSGGTSLGAPTTADMPTQLVQLHRTLSGGVTVKKVGFDYGLFLTAGVPINITLRIGSPQLQNATTATEPLVPPDGVVYSKKIKIVKTSDINNLYRYFFNPIVRIRDVVLTDLPITYSNLQITTKLDKLNSIASCGAMIIGRTKNIGALQAGAKIGIQDYSIKETDEFGNYSILERSFNNTASYSIWVDKSITDEVFSLLASYRATPILYLGDTEYTSTATYGFYEDFSIDLAYPTVNVCSLELKGLT